MPVDPNTQSVRVTICENAEEAIEKGYDYKATNVKAIEVVELVVVKGGTEAHRPTVDFIVKDETGQKFVFMLTAGLLRFLPLGDS